MALNNEFTKLNEQSLIEIIEKPENQEIQYRNNAKDELDSRNIPQEKIKEIAITVNEAIAYEMIMNEDTTQEEVSMHKSTFLDGEEIKQIYIDQLEKYMKYKNQFRFDVWSYAIGGI